MGPIQEFTDRMEQHLADFDAETESQQTEINEELKHLDLFEEEYRRTGGKDAMGKIMVDWSLKYPGIEDAQHVSFYSVRAVDYDSRLEYLQTAYRLGEDF
ncbi:MAG: hypothetical protein JSU72_18750 [Deltaproteobacteria bacterium]|nr:MAG: hypothetical protein JSU72_18750 [Deltaproteobacteria bacterium]